MKNSSKTNEKMIRRTASVCPVCLKRISARVVEEDSGKAFLEKNCEEHGAFRTLIWSGKRSLRDWRGGYPEMQEGEAPGCPENCGLCAHHLRGTCCVLLPVTGRCNFHCRFCFAEGGDDPSEDRPLSEIRKDIDGLAVKGVTLLQLSGGEPTCRDDLAEIIRYAKDRGCRYVQLNTNGRRLVQEPEYLKELAEAGLSFVFLQFDGTDDAVFRALRGMDLLEEKTRVIEECGKLGLGVTLVATVVPGVNDHQAGDLVRFGIAHSPFVRGVHFQPVSYFGRIPGTPGEEDRYTLDRLIDDVISQTDGLIGEDMLAPSLCDHPLCGFHGDFVVMPGGKLFPLTSRRQEAMTPRTEDGQAAADRNREFVGRRWQRMPARELFEQGSDAWDGGPMDMMTFLRRASSHGFTVTCMAFQDAGSLDLERLVNCSLHVYENGKHIPFCRYYLKAFSPAEKNQKDGRI